MNYQTVIPDLKGFVKLKETIFTSLLNQRSHWLKLRLVRDEKLARDEKSKVLKHFVLGDRRSD